MLAACKLNAMEHIRKNKFFALLLTLVVLCVGSSPIHEDDPRFVSFITPYSNIKMYWKDTRKQPLKSIQNLKSFVESTGHELRFAMNGGMFEKDNSPKGLFIEAGEMQAPLDARSGEGNFYLKPNGVFFVTTDSAGICETSAFPFTMSMQYATQSGPLLLIDGQTHPAFVKGSTNLNIRNGVGILPDKRVLFAMSKQEINFYDFAEFFKSQGCKNALYLDGFVSRTYLPEKEWRQLDGNFGVLIGVVK